MLQSSLARVHDALDDQHRIGEDSRRARSPSPRSPRAVPNSGVEVTVEELVGSSRSFVAEICDTWRRNFRRILKALFMGALYFGLGTLAFMQIEGWSATSALYFLMTTCSTVGYGDLYPGASRDEEWKGQYLAASRFFTVIYLLLGVIIVFAQLSKLVSDLFFSFLFRGLRNLLERFFPQQGVDVDGDGSYNFKLPRRPEVYYGKNLIGPVTIIMLTQCFCAWIFTRVQPGLDFGTSIYHCFVTATTVGYGDVSLNTESARLWAFFHIFISVTLLTATIDNVRSLARDRRVALHKLTLLRGKLDTDLMRSLDLDGDGVDKFEFVTGMLKKLDLVDEDDVHAFAKLFHTMDKDGSGRLTPDDIKQHHPKHVPRMEGGGTLEMAQMDDLIAHQRKPPDVVLSRIRRPNVKNPPSEEELTVWRKQCHELANPLGALGIVPRSSMFIDPCVPSEVRVMSGSAATPCNGLRTEPSPRV